MQYRLSTLLLAFVVVWSSLAVCGATWGIPAAVVLLAIAALYRSPEARKHSLSLLLAMRKRVPVLVVMLCGLCLVGLLLPATSAVREAPRRRICVNNLKQIGLALHNYHAVYGCFPPAYLVDKRGNAMHSWRTLILPYTENVALYRAYKFAEPWNGPNNGKLTALVLPCFCCPSDPSAQGRPVTSYVAVTGPGTMWGNRLQSGRTTVMVMDIANSGINWMEPRDLTLDEACHAIACGTGPGVSGHAEASDTFFFHDEIAGSYILFSDASVAFVPAGLPSETSKSILTGDKKVEDARKGFQPVRRRRIHWANCTALAVLVISYAVLLFRPREKRPPNAIPASPRPPAASGGKGSGE